MLNVAVHVTTNSMTAVGKSSVAKQSAKTEEQSLSVDLLPLTPVETEDSEAVAPAVFQIDPVIEGFHHSFRGYRLVLQTLTQDNLYFNGGEVLAAILQPREPR